MGRLFLTAFDEHTVSSGPMGAALHAAVRHLVIWFPSLIHGQREAPGAESSLLQFRDGQSCPVSCDTSWGWFQIMLLQVVESILLLCLPENVLWVVMSGQAWWDEEGLADDGVLVVSVFLGQGAEPANMWWSLISVPAIVTHLCQKLPCSGWHWWQCSYMRWPRMCLGPRVWKLSPLPVANVKRLSKYDGCSCSKSESVLVWAELCSFKKSEMLASSVSNTDISSSQNQTLPKLHQMEMFSTQFPF